MHSAPELTTTVMIRTADPPSPRRPDREHEASDDQRHAGERRSSRQPHPLIGDTVGTRPASEVRRRDGHARICWAPDVRGLGLEPSPPD